MLALLAALLVRILPPILTVPLLPVMSSRPDIGLYQDKCEMTTMTGQFLSQMGKGNHTRIDMDESENLDVSVVTRII